MQRYVYMDVMCYQRVPCSVFCMQSPIDYDTPGTRRPVIVQRSIALQQESHAEPCVRSVLIVNSQRGFRAHIIRQSVWRCCLLQLCYGTSADKFNSPQGPAAAVSIHFPFTDPDGARGCRWLGRHKVFLRRRCLNTRLLCGVRGTS